MDNPLLSWRILHILGVGGVFRMAQVILCEVSNCIHNQDGKKCAATEIFVAGHQAHTQEETDCKTFEPQ